METPKKPLIWGVTGLKGSGKSTFATLIRLKYRSTIGEVALADPLKESLRQALGGADRKYFYDQKWKKVPIPEWGFTGREAMQKYGNTMKSSFSAEFTTDQIPEGGIWLKSMILDCMTNKSHYDLILCTDVRYQGEADWIKEQGGKIIRIWEDKVVEHHKKEVLNENPEFTHPSEMGFFDLPYDYTIHNSMEMGITHMRDEVRRFIQDYVVKDQHLNQFDDTFQTMSVREIAVHVLFSVMGTILFVLLLYQMNLLWVWSLIVLVIFYVIMGVGGTLVFGAETTDWMTVILCDILAASFGLPPAWTGFSCSGPAYS
jgi:ABC-type oligopeptide transport system ATPase subunit